MNNTIRFLRESKDYSQTYLATYLKISRQMYIKYENGEVEPPVKIIRDLCKLYSVSYDFIIDDKLSENQKYDYYDINLTNCTVASPSVPYGVNNSENPQLNKLLYQIKHLPQKYIPSISAFISLLQQEEKASHENTKKTKNAFFDLVGKVNLDSDEVASFRQESLI